MSMAEKGYIYILMNASMPKLLKIGKTTKAPEERASELSVSTGVPTPYHVAYHVWVEDCDGTEKEIHDKLAPYRISNKREFFSAPLKLAISLLSEAESLMGTVSNENDQVVPENAVQPNASLQEREAMMNLGLQFQEGMGVRVNHIEAYAWYLLAKRYGAEEAAAKLGQLEHSLDPSDKKLAIYTSSYYRRNAQRLPKLEHSANLFFEAVRRGEAGILLRLGACFEEGRDVEQNYTLAMRCYLEAAKDKDRSICHKLGEIYEYGVGVSSDLERAYAFYLLAEQAGIEEAKACIAPSPPAAIAWRAAGSRTFAKSTFPAASISCSGVTALDC